MGGLAAHLLTVGIEIDDVYLKDCQVSRPASYACDVSNAERLWSLSEQLSKLAVQPNKL